LFNGFQKKTQKTPKGELDKAKKLMSEYFEKK
jgi:phage-related protein